MREKELNFEDKIWKGAHKLGKKIEVHEYICHFGANIFKIPFLCL